MWEREQIKIVNAKIIKILPIVFHPMLNIFLPQTMVFIRALAFVWGGIEWNAWRTLPLQTFLVLKRI